MILNSHVVWGIVAAVINHRVGHPAARLQTIPAKRPTRFSLLVAINVSGASTLGHYLSITGSVREECQAA